MAMSPQKIRNFFFAVICAVGIAPAVHAATFIPNNGAALIRSEMDATTAAPTTTAAGAGSDKTEATTSAPAANNDGGGAGGGDLLTTGKIIVTIQSKEEKVNAAAFKLEIPTICEAVFKKCLKIPEASRSTVNDACTNAKTEETDAGGQSGKFSLNATIFSLDQCMNCIGKVEVPNLKEIELIDRLRCEETQLALTVKGTGTEANEAGSDTTTAAATTTEASATTTTAAAANDAGSDKTTAAATTTEASVTTTTAAAANDAGSDTTTAAATTTETSATTTTAAAATTKKQ